MPLAYFSFWFSRRPYDKVSWDTLSRFSIDRLCSQLEMSHEFQIFWLLLSPKVYPMRVSFFFFFFFHLQCHFNIPWQMLAQHLALFIRFKMYQNSFSLAHKSEIFNKIECDKHSWVKYFLIFTLFMHRLCIWQTLFCCKHFPKWVHAFPCLFISFFICSLHRFHVNCHIHFNAPMHHFTKRAKQSRIIFYCKSFVKPFLHKLPYSV